MKNLLASLVIICFTFAAGAQTTTPQDTAKARQNTSPSKNKPETAPVINRIAVSDPGMPAEKNTTSTKRSSSEKPSERKKKNKNKSDVVAPK